MENEENIRPFRNLIEIPSDFYNTNLEAPFTHCTVCDNRFTELDTYIVEKACKRVNKDIVYTLFEYAICLPCGESFNQEMSEDSLIAIQKYMVENANLQSNMKYMAEENPDYKNWLNKCIIKGTEREKLSEYNICGLFLGDKMMLGELPYLMSLEAMEELVEILSKKTKDEMDGFKRKHLDGPPEFEELFNDRPVVML